MTRGIFHRPKPASEPNVFEAVALPGCSELIKADPTYFKARKRGTSQAADSKSHITVIGQRTRTGISPTYNQVVAYRKAKASTKPGSKQSGHITSSANCWLGALVITVGLAMVQQLDITLDGPSEWAAAKAVAEEAQALASRDWAARQVCGHEAAFVWVSDTHLQCQTKHGRKVGKPQAVTVAGVLP